MKYKLSISPAAFIDTKEEYFYYEKQQTGLGERFINTLDEAYKKLSDTPQNYGFVGERNDLRDFRLKNFPYNVIFEIAKDQVLVLRVFNTSRNPQPFKKL